MGFAANSLLTRLALGRAFVDPATFTLIRLASGAVTLAVVASLARRRLRPSADSWWSAAALFVYAIAFSYAYLRIGAGFGALILFGCVQTTMVGWGLLNGERPRPVEWIGLATAVGGLLLLTAPGGSAPDLTGSLLMAAAGMAWAVYSLRGQAVDDPIGATARNFSCAVVFAVLVSIGSPRSAEATWTGVSLAVASGSLASGVGYALWYRAVPALTSLQAAVAQLSVPVLTAIGATWWLGERVTVRLVVGGAVILSGVVLVMVGRTRHRVPR